MRWFQVDADTPDDPKVRAVYNALGTEGVGALFLLWCCVANHGEHRPGWSLDSKGKPVPIGALRDASGLDSAKFAQLISICTSTGHFDRRAWRRRHLIVIPAMEKRADSYTKRKLRAVSEPSANNGRTVSAQRSKNVRVQYSTYQTSTPYSPPSRGTRKYSRRELAHAATIRKNHPGCMHRPKCRSYQDCLSRIVTDLRAKDGAS